MSNLQRAPAGSTTKESNVLCWQLGVIHKATEVDGLPNASEALKHSMYRTGSTGTVPFCVP